MPNIEITEHILKTDRHTSFYLAAGPKDGPLVVFTHGWPELSLSWRHQLPFFAAMGFRAIAPDMRGYGRSSVYDTHDAYRLEPVVEDMLELIDSLKREKALWIGHDWGSPVAWSMAGHHPERCFGVVNLCVPYATVERGLDEIINRVDRNIYPENIYPAGQWEYMRYYEENFPRATAVMDANPRNLIRLIFQKGDPAGAGQPSGTAMVRIMGGWFGEASEAPEVPRDEDIISEEELDLYAGALSRNGFFGPNSWYMNHEANARYFEQSANAGVIEMPALFLAAQYDYTCESITSRLPELMREKCNNLDEAVIFSGHWMAQEKPFDVNRELIKWIVRKLPEMMV
jgi:soluble epoxide hydrolase / lipid-phosphate phosphatase